MRDIKEFIKEASINAKKRNLKFAKNLYIKGKKIDNIASFAIITAENPNSKELTRKENGVLMRNFTKQLKTSNYKFVNIDGHFGGNVEHSYIIFNIKVQTLKEYAGLYEQTSFFYCYPTDNGIMSEYWEKKDTTANYNRSTNDYMLINKTINWANENDATDNFSVIGGDFKYSIDPEVFSQVTDEINEGLSNVPTKLSRTDLLDTMVNGVGQKSSYYRSIINN